MRIVLLQQIKWYARILIVSRQSGLCDGGHQGKKRLPVADEGKHRRRRQHQNDRQAGQQGHQVRPCFWKNWNIGFDFFPWWAWYPPKVWLFLYFGENCHSFQQIQSFILMNACERNSNSSKNVTSVVRYQRYFINYVSTFGTLSLRPSSLVRLVNVSC